jgi:hypothetical protein
MAGTPTEFEPVAGFEPVPPDAAARPTVRPPRQPGRRARRRAPVLLTATVTASWAAIVSYVPVLVLVGLLLRADATTFRLGTGTWLLAHGVPIATDAGPVGLIPLGLTALAGWRVARAGVHTCRAIGARTLRRAALATIAVSAVYGGLGALAAGLAGQPAAPTRAGLTLGGFALLLSGLGAAVESRLARRVVRRLPLAVRDGLRTGVVAALLVLGAGAAVAGIALAVSGGQASATLASYRTGVAGQAGLTVLCLGYAPNLATWSAAYLIGPGFAVGVGTTVSAAKVKLGVLPAIPVLAGLPDSAVSGLGPLLLGLPMAGGMAAGWLLVRRRLRQAAAGEAPLPGWAGLLGPAALTGPVAGALLGLAGWLSGGPLGSGRLAVIGPDGGQVALVGALVVAVGALLAAAATKVLLGSRR